MLTVTVQLPGAAPFALTAAAVAQLRDVAKAQPGGTVAAAHYDRVVRALARLELTPADPGARRAVERAVGVPVV